MPKETAPVTADINLTLEGVPDTAETVNVKQDFTEGVPVEVISDPAHTTVGVAADDTTATAKERERGWKKCKLPLVNATVSFRGIKLPAAIAPLRLATRSAPPPQPSTRPFVRTLSRPSCPLPSANRSMQPARPWWLSRGRPASGNGLTPRFCVGCLELAQIATSFAASRWSKVFGLDGHFTTFAQAAAALSLLKAVERPSPELDAAVSKKYMAEVRPPRWQAGRPPLRLPLAVKVGTLSYFLKTIPSWTVPS